MQLLFKILYGNNIWDLILPAQYILSVDKQDFTQSLQIISFEISELCVYFASIFFFQSK